MTELRLASATTPSARRRPCSSASSRASMRASPSPPSQREPAWRPARPGTRPRGHPRLPAHPHRRARQHRQVPLAHVAAAALSAAAQLRRGARGRAGAPRRGTRGAPPGRDHPFAARPAPLRRAARAPLRAGARPGARAPRSGPRLRGGPARPAGASCRGERGRRQRCLTAGPGQAAAPAHPAPADALGRPSARHSCRGSRCAPPPACSASPATRSARYVLAGGPPGRQGAASSTEQRPAREDIFAEPLSGQSR